MLTAKRIALPYGSAETVAELRRVASDMQARGVFQRHDPWPILRWYFDFLRIVDPNPLRRQISRDLRDDPYLACALESQAKFVVSRDRDLLVLGKPFGIEILTPRAFLSRVAALF